MVFSWFLIFFKRSSLTHPLKLNFCSGPVFLQGRHCLGGWCGGRCVLCSTEGVPHRSVLREVRCHHLATTHHWVTATRAGRHFWLLIIWLFNDVYLLGFLTGFRPFHLHRGSWGGTSPKAWAFHFRDARSGRLLLLCKRPLPHRHCRQGPRVPSYQTGPQGQVTQTKWCASLHMIHPAYVLPEYKLTSYISQCQHLFDFTQGKIN